MKKIITSYKTPFIIALVTILVISVGVTFAFMTDLTDQIVNRFFPGDISAEVVEEFDGEIKEHVVIKNTSEKVDAYIRAYYVVPGRMITETFILPLPYRERTIP